MNIKKILIGLILLLILAEFASCKSDRPNDSSNTDAPNNGESASDNELTDPSKPVLPEVDYKGDAFTFLVQEYVNGYWGSYEIYAEEETGDPINDAVYIRNRKVEEKLNINIKEVRTDAVHTTAQKSIGADESSYDCIMPALRYAADMASNGYLISLDQLPYINLEGPWWDQNANAGMTIGNRLFFTVGDLNIMDKDSLFIVMFNKAVAQNNGVENLYNLIRENKWTMDKFHSIIKETAQDINGDGKMGFEDMAGLLTSSYCINILYYHTGETATRKDADGYPYFTMNNERGIRAAEKAFEIITDKSATVLAEELTGVGNVYDAMQQMFQSDRGLFYMMQITYLHRMRTMESDFGILPTPKLDEMQDKYYTAINREVANCVAVPVTVRDREKTSVIIEALAGESKYTVIPAYYEITITNKMIRDEESAEMLDIILSSRVFDLGFIFGWGDLGNVPWSLYPNKGGNFVSTYEKREPVAISEMEKTIEAFKNLNN